MDNVCSCNSAGCDRKRFEAIDVVKLLCAILIVAVHIPPFDGGTSEAARLLHDGINCFWGRIAVPFFFICTGFFTFRKLNPAAVSLKDGFRSAKRIYWLYLIWTLIYAPVIIKNRIKSGGSLMHGIIEFIKDFIFYSGYEFLWYLNAAAFAIVLISFLLHKRVEISWIIGAASIVSLLGMLTQSYYGVFRKLEAFPVVWNSVKLLENVITNTRNGLFEGFLFVSLGMLFAYKPIRLSFKKSVIALCASIILMFLEFVLLARLGGMRGFDLYLFMGPTAFFLFHVAAHLKLKKCTNSVNLRNIASIVYFIHLYVNLVVSKICIILEINIIGTGYLFLAVTAVSIIIAYVVNRLSRCRGFKWIKAFF